MSERLTDAAIREAQARIGTHDLSEAENEALCLADEALARGEESAALRAEVERRQAEYLALGEAYEKGRATIRALTDETVRLRAALDDTEGEACDVCPGTGWHEDREGRSVCVCIQETEAGGWLVAQVEKLKALLCNCDEEGGGHAPDCASSVREELEAAQEEIERLRAAAIPEDAEERVAQTMWTHDEWSPPTLAEADASNLAKVRAGAMIYRDRARAVLAALRRQA